jgi:hypothetical protein
MVRLDRLAPLAGIDEFAVHGRPGVEALERFRSCAGNRIVGSLCASVLRACWLRSDVETSKRDAVDIVGEQIAPAVGDVGRQDWV